MISIRIFDDIKHTNSYREIVKLFSTQLPTQELREAFILSVAETDILLAAECKTSSVEEEKRIVDNIVSKSEKQVRHFANAKYSLIGFLALLELEKFDLVLANLLLLRKHTHTPQKYRIHKPQKYDIIIKFLVILIK